MKRWGRMAVLSVLALGLAVQEAAVAAPPGYDLQKILCETDKDPTGATFGDGDSGKGWFQINGLNNSGQFTFNTWGSGGERSHFWDGTKTLVVVPTTAQVGGGAITQGSMWAPSGINDAGKVSFIADTPDVSPHSVVVWDSKTQQYTLIANKDAQVAGGTLTGNGVAYEGRMVTDINNKDQVVWSEGFIPTDEETANDAVFLFDPVTKQITIVARKGIQLPSGQTILNALWPTINDNSQVVFMANTAENEEDFGVYQWESGTITTIAAPDTKVGDLTIESAEFPHNSDAGHVVFVGELVSSGSPVPVTENTGVFLHSGGTIKKVVAPGDQLADGAIWTGLEASRRAIGVNDSGTVAYKGYLEGNGGGVFLWKDGQTSTVTRIGETITGAGEVQAINRHQGDMSGYMLAINDPGDVAFSAFVAGQECFFLAKAPRSETPPSAGE